MTTDATEAKAGPGGKGPRTYKDKPTARERVLTESLAKKVKELTGRDVTAETARAVRWTISRWYEDPETKELMTNMDAQLKRAKAQEKFEKAQAALREAQAELGDTDDEDEDGEDYDVSVDVSDSDDEDDSDDDEDDDIFDESDKKVSASF